MRPIRLVAVVLIVAVVAVGIAGAVVFYLYPQLLYPTSGTCPSGANASSEQGYFTIVISSQGFNDSRSAASCPTMNVVKGQSVTIHVENNDSETHGFAIAQYLPGGMTLQAGQSKDVTFTADQAGSFQIFCNIWCAAHHFQQHGRLVVTG